MIAEAVAAVTLTRGPVAESVTQRSAIVSFRTSASDHDFVLLRDGVRVDAGTGLGHVAKLTRLTPGRHYEYTVEGRSGVLAPGRFAPLPPGPPGSPSRWWATSAAERATSGPSRR